MNEIPLPKHVIHRLQQIENVEQHLLNLQEALADFRLTVPYELLQFSYP